ncbi:hypothetical protein V8C37DRAFT_386981 [Trichoderma ceciliae]
MRRPRPSTMPLPQRTVSNFITNAATLVPVISLEHLVLVIGVSPSLLGSDTARAIVAQKPAKSILAIL